MSGGPVCKCSEKDVPIHYPVGFRARDTRHPMPDQNTPAIPRLWRVLTRHGNHSKFGGSRFQSSRHSCCTCLRCGRVWRTAADYVDHLADIADDERNISSGIEGHIAAMRSRGREPHENHGAAT